VGIGGNKSADFFGFSARVVPQVGGLIAA